MKDISLHLLDVIENSINAGAKRVEVRIVIDRPGNLLTLNINDDGEGMDEEAMQRALDPFYTSKPGKRVGLGIPMLAQSAREGGGRLKIDSNPGGGVSLVATFQLDHPDTRPLGDVDATIRMLQITHPEIEFDYTSEEL
jgi:signal transduction histidine kinase